MLQNVEYLNAEIFWIIFDFVEEVLNVLLNAFCYFTPLHMLRN